MPQIHPNEEPSRWVTVATTVYHNNWLPFDPGHFEPPRLQFDLETSHHSNNRSTPFILVLRLLLSSHIRAQKCVARKTK